MKDFNWHYDTFLPAIIVNTVIQNLAGEIVSECTWKVSISTKNVLINFSRVNISNPIFSNVFPWFIFLIYISTGSPYYRISTYSGQHIYIFTH